ncbi:hypothetical protein PU629_21080 [Pullulanibacillus sp. KACC 23026]|uniref:YkvI family membrane protein n=1 Tax=Pullulanibacillus sp. KACC 23026 TaxID=3028315 RepID=UPI0023B063F5|nr:hypothetical protein [Pullulanibacillus sp. KACC 23026]WEG12551.1 hypothetical protein PU629_21080 [Pullulanibacillus sp. KACC 23026]
MKSYLTSLKIAFTLVGTIIGAGFATGKEIFQFFTQYGAWGTIGVVVSGLLYMWTSTKIMVISYHIQARSFNEFNHFLFGKHIGRFLSAITLCMMIGVTAVMLSGAGALFKEQLGWSPLIGSFIVIGICFLSLQRGIDGVLIINSLVVPIMVTIVIIMAFIQFPVLHVSDWFPVQAPSLHSFWLINAIYYVSFNLVTTQAVLVPLGHDIQDLKAIKRGGVLGGLLFAVCLFAGHLAILSLSDAKLFDIPMVVLAERIGPLFYGLVFVLIIGEILTTYVGNIYGMTRQMTSFINVPESLLIISLLVITFLVSLFDYGTLIESLYPFFGQLGLFFTAMVIVRRTPSNIALKR